MLYEDNTAKLLGLEDVIIKKVREDESAHHIELELPRRKHSCPCCGAETDRMHATAVGNGFMRRTAFSHATIA